MKTNDRIKMRALFIAVEYGNGSGLKFQSFVFLLFIAEQRKSRKLKKKLGKLRLLAASQLSS